MQIAALFVETNGVYFGLPHVDPWDKRRDARKYDGPHPVVAHPPCERWSRYWSGGPSASIRREKGADGGCFAAALAAVRRFGGVLEHPEASHAWTWFGLTKPPRCGGWVVADFEGGWCCCVEQGAYGHRGRKATWLYAHGIDLPSLKWGRAPGRFDLLDEGWHSKEERARKIKTGICQRLSKTQRAATPIAFRDLLIGMALMKKIDPNYDTLAEREEPVPAQAGMDLGNKLDRLVDEYDGTDDFARSIDEAYRVIRERMANGGPGWTPK